MIYKMDKLNNYLPCLLLCLSGFSFVLSAEDVCVQKSPCRCEFSNGTGIDISNSTKSTFYTAQKVNYAKAPEEIQLVTFYFHPCSDAVSPVNSSNPTYPSCKDPLSLVRDTKVVTQVDKTNGTYNYTEGMCEKLGNANNSTFSADGKYINFKIGPSSTIVYLACTENDELGDNLAIPTLEDPKNLTLTFYTKNACLRQIEEIDLSGRSTGSTLLIIFFTLLIFYLVLGVCTKKFLMGATGIEVVPNLAFWTELPNLVRDGWSFALNGFKLPARGPGPVSSPDPNSYDSI